MGLRFIADLHLYDKYSLDWRDYLNMSLDEYANYLVDNWNFFCHEDDVILVAGDIGHYCERTISTLRKLKGNLVLVVGNHDVEWGNYIYTCGVFKGIHEIATLFDDIYIKHIPEFSDIEMHKYRYLIHGHHHRYDMPNMSMKLNQYARNGKRLNCAADMNNNRPCTLQELILNKEVSLERYREMGLIKEDL